MDNNDYAEALTKLAEPFPAADLEWRIGNKVHDQMRASALPFVTNRAIMNRLDDIFGPFNWRNEFVPWKNGSQLCGISVYITRTNGGGEWVTKWDGADDSNIDPIKGGLSDAMKRAAVQWGIGRYLYNLPRFYMAVVAAGKNRDNKEQYVLDFSQGRPQLPDWALPAAERGKHQGAQPGKITPATPPAAKPAAPPAQPPAKPATPPPAAPPAATTPPAAPPAPAAPNTEPATPPGNALPPAPPQAPPAAPAKPPAQKSVFDEMGEKITREDWGRVKVKQKNGEWTVATAPDHVLQFYAGTYTGSNNELREAAKRELAARREEAEKIARDAINIANANREMANQDVMPDDEIPF